MEDIKLDDLQKIIDSLPPQAKVEFYPLSIRKEKEAYIVGRVDLGKFVSLPLVGKKVIKLFQDGQSFKQVQASVNQEFTTEVDLKKFLLTLARLGFIAWIGDYQVPTKTSRVDLPSFKPEHVAWMFSLPMYILIAILVIAAAVTVAINPKFFPTFNDFFWLETTSLVLIANFIIRNGTSLLHELVHLAAARSLGLPGKISFGTRLQFLVWQTDISGVWSLPINRRYRVYFAGMIFNLLVSALAVLIIAYIPQAQPLVPFLKAVILFNFFSLIPQFYLHIRTDLYFVLLNLLGCYNLYADALDYFKYKFRKIWVKNSSLILSDPSLKLPSEERNKVHFYMYFMLGGSVCSLLFFGFYTVPIIAQTYIKAFNSITLGILQTNIKLLIDGVVSFSIQGVYLLLFLVFFSKKHKQAINKAFYKLKLTSKRVL